MIKLLAAAIVFLAFEVTAQDPWKDVYSRKSWAERDTWQRPQEIVAFLKLHARSVVADIGCHEGYFSMKLAKRAGTVYAVDISERKLDKLKAIAAEHKVDNVEAILGEAGDPRLPAPVDAILIVDTFHEIENPIPFLKRVLSYMKSGGRIVICEPIADERRGAERHEQSRRHELESRYAIHDLKSAGFRIVATHENFVDRTNIKGDRMWVIVAEKP